MFYQLMFFTNKCEDDTKNESNDFIYLSEIDFTFL